MEFDLATRSQREAPSDQWRHNMTKRKDNMLGTKDNPVDNSASGQSELKQRESSTSLQPGSVQRGPKAGTGEKYSNERQDSGGLESPKDFVETKEALCQRAKEPLPQQGGIAIGKSGQGAGRDKNDPTPGAKPDSYKDISPYRKR
jgi:hypothetical protein